MTLPIVSELTIVDPAKTPRIPVFRMMDEDGTLREGIKEPEDSPEDLLTMYKTMLRINQMDTIFYDAQRQVRGIGIMGCMTV